MFLIDRATFITLGGFMIRLFPFKIIILSTFKQKINQLYITIYTNRMSKIESKRRLQILKQFRSFFFKKKKEFINNSASNVEEISIKKAPNDT